MLATLISLAFIVPAVWSGYTLRAWWIVRGDWDHFSPDTKAFYLLVAPPLTFALDLLVITDRIFFWPTEHQRSPGRSFVRTLVAVVGTVALAEVAMAADRNPEHAPPPESEVMLEEARQSPGRLYLNASEAAAVQYHDVSEDVPDASNVTDGEN